jgi:hypothetical protein
MALPRLMICVGPTMLVACANLEDVRDLGSTEQGLVHSNKVALNKVALNKVALNKVALNLLGINKVALNKVALNKVALNQASLDMTAPAYQLDRVDIAWDGTEYDIELTRSALAGAELIESNDEGISFVDVTAEDLVNLFEKSSRCLNALGVPTQIYLDGVLQNIDAHGMFALASRNLNYREYIETYQSCMAVWANDHSVLINATAELPPSTEDVPADSSEVDFNVPAESVAYKLILGDTVIDGGETYVAIDGRWMWNVSRHQSWSATLDNLRTWFPAIGTYDQTEDRACLAAALAREPMPPVCGGDASEYWAGPLTPGLNVPLDENTAPWCNGRLGRMIDFAKGTGCNSPRGTVSSVFYADLLGGTAFEDYFWALIVAEMGSGKKFMFIDAN